MLVVDAGPLVAAAGTHDRDHRRCVDFLSQSTQQLVVPALVVTEVAYFLGTIGATAELAFAHSLRDGELHVEPVEPSDWVRIAELVEQYADLPLGITDASVVATCERLGARTLATLDRRLFSVVRPRHCEALDLVPA